MNGKSAPSPLLLLPFCGMIGTISGVARSSKTKGSMTMLKRILALTLSLALGASLLAGCSKGSSSSSSADSSTPTVELMDLSGVTDPYQATAGIAGDTVMATVNGLDITADDFLYWLNYGIDLYVKQVTFAEPDYTQDVDGKPLSEAFISSALTTSAFYALVADNAAKAGVSLPQAELDALDAELAQMEESLGSKEMMEHILWYQLCSTQQYTRACERGMLYNELTNAYYGEGAADYPTDAEVLAFAEDSLGAYRAKHILLLTKDMTQPIKNEEGKLTGYASLDDKTVAEKTALAHDIVAQLQAADDPIALFDQLMQEHSEDSGLPYYPDGYTTSKGEMVPEFENTALSLKVGEFSDVVESAAYGYHILLRLPLDPAEYRSQLVTQLMEARCDQWLADADIQTTEACDKLDVAAFRGKVLSLQAAVSAEVEALEAQKAAEAGSSSAAN